MMNVRNRNTIVWLLHSTRGLAQTIHYTAGATILDEYIFLTMFLLLSVNCTLRRRRLFDQLGKLNQLYDMITTVIAPIAMTYSYYNVHRLIIIAIFMIYTHCIWFRTIYVDSDSKRLQIEFYDCTWYIYHWYSRNIDLYLNVIHIWKLIDDKLITTEISINCDPYCSYVYCLKINSCKLIKAWRSIYAYILHFKKITRKMSSKNRQFWCGKPIRVSRAESGKNKQTISFSMMFWLLIFLT